MVAHILLQSTGDAEAGKSRLSFSTAKVIVVKPCLKLSEPQTQMQTGDVLEWS